MIETMDEALVVVRQRRPSNEEFLEACQYLVDHRAELSHRVFVNLPGGLRGNSNPIWDAVKEQSESRCGCGNERVINPANPREDYEASETGPVVLTAEREMFLRPVGGDLPSTYLTLKVEEEASGVSFLEDPFAPFVLTLDIFSTKGFVLADLAKVMEEQDNPPVFMRKREGATTPIFAINAIDAENLAVTITPDAAVEVFYRGQAEAEETSTHECN